MASAEGSSGGVSKVEKSSGSEGAGPTALQILSAVATKICLEEMKDVEERVVEVDMDWEDFKFQLRKGRTLRRAISCPELVRHPAPDMAHIEEHPFNSDSSGRPIVPSLTTIELIQSTMCVLKNTKLYLLQEIPPHTFVIGDESMEHKFYVMIGPQTCSCDTGPHCIHLLCVMLRVFQIPESDPQIYAEKLKSYEVKELFDKYHLLLCSKIHGLSEGIHSNAQNGTALSEALEPSTSGMPNEIAETLVEKDRCPICLLDMLDDDRTVTCTSTCFKKLHYDCMAIWANESIQQYDDICCPLCKQPWTCEPDEFLSLLSSVPERQLSPIESPRYFSSDYDSSLTRVLSALHYVTITNHWIEWLFKGIMKKIIRLRLENVNQMFEFLQPIIDALLIKCAYSHTPVAHHCLAILMELTKETESVLSFQGTHILLSCILQNWTWRSASCHWLVGRLVLLCHLIEVFPETYWLQQPPYAISCSSCTDGTSNMVSILEFAFQAMNYPNCTVTKLARRIFVLSSNFTLGEEILLNKVLDILPALDCSLQRYLRRRIDQAASSSTAEAQEEIPTFELPLQKDSCYFEGQNVVLKPELDHAKVNGQQDGIPSSFSSSHLPLMHRSRCDKQPVEPPCLSNGSCSKSNFRLNMPGNTLPTKQESSDLARPNSDHFQCNTNIQSTPSQNTTEVVVVPIDFSKIIHKEAQDMPFPGCFPSEQNCHSEVRNSYIEDINWKKGKIILKGGFGTCFQAQDTATGTLMAVKQLIASDVSKKRTEENIRREITTMARLRHLNIVRIFGATKHENNFNIFMEWMSGGSVADLLKQYGPLGEKTIINYTKQLLEGLAYLHENHVMHCDIKGANLLIDNTGRHLRIADFGLAVWLNPKNTASGLFEREFHGTVEFMAPEVARCEHYDTSCDIWGVGCCVKEMATTYHPWKDDKLKTKCSMAYMIASSVKPPSIPENLSQELKDLVSQCLQLESHLRPTAKVLLHHDCFAISP